MKNGKIKVTAVIAALGAISAGAALVACGGGTQQQPAGKYLSNYTFPASGTHAVDPEIKLDGKLDDEIYKNQRWLEVHKEHGGETATMRMTSYYGEQGVYLGIDVTESCRIYVNHARASYLNSGIEMYLAMEGTESIDVDNSFEVDMEADGTLTFKRRVKGGWDRFHTSPDIMAQLVTTQKGGAVNTENCHGYTHELFIPYDYLVWLGAMEEGKELGELYVNPVLISSYSYDGTRTNVDRHWYNTVEDQIDGTGWGTPSTNYHFNAKGLLSHDINVTCVGDGTAGEYRGYDYAVDKNNCTIKAEANAGSRLKSFIINGRDRKNDLQDGMLTLPVVTADINIQATFEKIPSEKGTISGNIAYTGTDSAFLDDIDVVAFDGSNTYTATVDRENGSYTVQVPYGEYRISVVSSTGGYRAADVNTTLSSANASADFTIDDTMYGSTRTIYLNDAVMSGGSKELYSEDEAPIESNKFVYKTFLGLADNARNIADANRYVTEQWLYCGGNWARFQLMNWEGGYHVKLIWMDNGKEMSASASITGAAKTLMTELNGMYLALIRDGSKISVAYLNASGNWSNLISGVEVSTFASGAALTRINFASAEGVSGDFPTASFGGTIIQGTADPAQLPPVKVITAYDATLVNIEGLQESYAIGSTVTFSATPVEGYIMKAYLNGKELEASGAGYTFTMLGRAELRFDTIKDDPQDLSINIRGYRFGEYTDLDGVEVELKGIKDYTATVDKGVLKVNGMIAGEYELVIAGYGTKIVNFGVDQSVTLAFAMFAENPSWETKDQNSKDPTVYALWGRADIRSESSFGDFVMETEIKYNTRLASTASSTSADAYTQRKGYNLTFSNGKTLQPSLNYHSISFSPLSEDTAVAGSSWNGVYTLTDEEIEKYHSTGIKLGLARIGRCVSVTVDGKTVAEFVLPSDFTDQKVNVGYHQYCGNSAVKEAYKFSFDETVSRDVKLSEDSIATGCKIELDGTPMVGDNVKIKITPTVTDADATLMAFMVNGKEYASEYKDGAVIIETCCSNNLNVVAKYAKPMFDVAIEQGSWDMYDLDKGVVLGSNFGVLNFGEKTDFMAKTTFKYDRTSVEGRREFIMFFHDAKKCISFGAIRQNGEEWIQCIGNEGEYTSLYPWSDMLSNNRVFNASELEKCYGDGLEMMIVRKGANIYLFIDGVYERTISLSGLGADAATMECTLKMRTWSGALSGQPSKMAFDDAADKYVSAASVVIDGKIQNGSVTADKQTYNPLDKERVTLTVTPASGYMLKSLTVCGKDVTDAIVGGKYSFIGAVCESEITAE
ncbi:MAG: hypothetical protein K2L54_02475, partial [Clostridiales bacterium]|nr:hypothetical protein [Clostridiales bacterium]